LGTRLRTWCDPGVAAATVPVLALTSALLITGGTVPAGGQARPAAVAVAPYGAPDGAWRLEFEDDFDGDSLDETKWSSGFGWGETSGNTVGYCDPDHNIVSDGVLEQRIERRTQGGMPFSVGCINSRARFSQLYGYWEASIRMAGCRGARGAFWAKPDDESWPPELDVVEVYGDDRDRADLTIHWEERGDYQRDKGNFTGPDFSAGFHVFAARWSPEETIWYIDGVEVRRTTAGTRFMNDGGAFYTMIEAQVIRESSRCGEWPYYSSQYVDYVRIWSPSCCSCDDEDDVSPFE
ncbi:MAG: glycoside hydrolase family 16 protein, partial [Actinomycetota bacterium]|nr:glycoside hydrolase family 16 protein [Actinomycetota bacterium]